MRVIMNMCVHAFVETEFVRALTMRVVLYVSNNALRYSRGHLHFPLAPADAVCNGSVRGRRRAPLERLHRVPFGSRHY